MGKPIEPKITPLVSFESGFVPKKGHYHLIEVDDKGNEIAGTDLGVGEFTYNRSFKDNPKYKVKKSPVTKSN